MDISLIRQIAKEFREAIERTDRSRLPTGFEAFPRGSCGDASLLLGAYLKDRTGLAFEYICGERGEIEDWRSHAWLQLDGVIVDITADQFPDAPEPVIVSTDSAWHRSFETCPPAPGDFRAYDPSAVARLAGPYGLILRSMADADL